MRTQSLFNLSLDLNKIPSYLCIKEPILLTYNLPIVLPIYCTPGLYIIFPLLPLATALIVISHGKVAKIFTPFRANDTT